ncbi:MAG: hypothetical protein D6812_04455, partial [Deltaproteobacteria bacterium]
KRLPGMAYFRLLEEATMKHLARELGLEFPIPDSVEEADKEAARQEGSVLIPGWSDPPKVTLFSPLQCWSPTQARSQFLARYEELSNGNL